MVAAYQIEPERMDRADPKAWGRIGDGDRQARRQLSGGTIRECQDKDGCRIDPLGKKRIHALH